MEKFYDIIRIDGSDWRLDEAGVRSQIGRRNWKKRGRSPAVIIKEFKSGTPSGRALGFTEVGFGSMFGNFFGGN